MKRKAWILLCAAALSLGVVGCEWDTGSDATSWSSSYNWVNFSGVYRSAGNLGVLVTSYTVTPDNPSTTTVETVSSESLGSFGSGVNSFSGKLRNEPVIPGSVVIRLYDRSNRLIQSFADNSAGVLGNNVGSIQYVSGAWSINLPASPSGEENVTVSGETQGRFTAGARGFSGKLANSDIVPSSLVVEFKNDAHQLLYSAADDGSGNLGDNGNIQYVSGAWRVETPLLRENGYVVCRYTYKKVVQEGVISGGYLTASYSYGDTTEVSPGSTGKTINSFDVHHQGQHITITDNNGAVFKGYISQMRSSSGAERGDEVDRYMPQNGDSIIASFEASGTSAVGLQVKIVGTFSGGVAANSDDSSVFVDRVLNGTWIESGGKTGDINGRTSNIQIQTPQPATTGETSTGGTTTTTGTAGTTGTTAGGTTGTTAATGGGTPATVTTNPTIIN